MALGKRVIGLVFQSTLSMRRATSARQKHRGFRRISIHALHEESDPLYPTRHWPSSDFNPRSP